MEMTPLKNITPESDYRDKLLKLIPGEVVAAYITIDGIIPAQENSAKWVSLLVSIVLLAAVPIYLVKTFEVINTRQIYFTMASFLVWLYSLGGPFKLWGPELGFQLHVPYIGSILLILWTLLIPLVVTAKPAMAPLPATSQS